MKCVFSRLASSTQVILALVVASSLAAATFAAEPRSFSGIYPHLAMFNDEGECGTGAVVPWADRLWVITYGPHLPFGSSDKLYEITPELRQIIRPESIGGTPANRMIHRESQQLIIGPYVIDAERKARVISPNQMPGRLTGNARSLGDPANKVFYATMEEGLYEVDVRSLAVTSLIRDGNGVKKGLTVATPLTDLSSKLPGYHGKGLFSSQGRVIYANNGEHGQAALTIPSTPSGALGEWRAPGDDWQLVRRNQFTEVTGPGGIFGNEKPGTDPVWSIGWDHRSLILMCLDGGQWHSYRLPKASHSYDGAHGWNTEWPRIRDIGENDLLMTMHGTFWRFPKSFTSTSSSGIAPRSMYLKVIGDFARWGERIVFGCDDTAKSEFLNKRKAKGSIAGPGQSQSNLWFVEPAKLDHLGPASGQGAVWLNDDVKAGEASEPFLFSGYDHRAVHIAHRSPAAVRFQFEMDAKGDGKWQPLCEVEAPASGYVWRAFTKEEAGAWVRVKTSRPAAAATVQFHFRNQDKRTQAKAEIFSPLLTAKDTSGQSGLLHARGGGIKTLRHIPMTGEQATGCHDLDGSMALREVNDPEGQAWTAKNVAIPKKVLTMDEASIIYDDGKTRWRLPFGDAAFRKPGPLGDERVCREVCTERDLLNAGGAFFELPAENAGGMAKVRPIATHNCRIKDYASYRGLLVMSGLKPDAGGERIIRSDDNKAALWAGAVDDLWHLGKPRGSGGPWMNTKVKAGEPSDAYLMNGYDQKVLKASHDSSEPVTFKVEADITGAGDWVRVTSLSVPADNGLEHVFPEAFHAYWVRLTADKACTATAVIEYR